MSLLSTVEHSLVMGSATRGLLHYDLLQVPAISCQKVLITYSRNSQEFHYLFEGKSISICKQLQKHLRSESFIGARCSYLAFLKHGKDTRIVEIQVCVYPPQCHHDPR